MITFLAIVGGLGTIFAVLVAFVCRLLSRVNWDE